MTTRTLRVLHVGPETGESLATALEAEDSRFTVETVASAEAALEFVAESAVDCVVSEYDIKGRNGVDLLRAVRGEYPDLPFVLFAGSGSEAVASEAIAAGVTDYIPKNDGQAGDDCGHTTLADRVANAVERHRSERALQTLNETTRELMTVESRKSVAEITVRAARDVLGLDANAVHLHDEERDALVPVAATAPAYELVGDMPTFTGEESIAWRAFRNGETVVLDDVHDDPDTYNPDSPVRGELVFPVGSFGTLIAGSPMPEAFDQQDVVRGEILAGNAAAALNQVERTEQLRAHKDELSRQNDRLEEFVGVVSHDLRNPLNVASGNLELLREECDSEHVAAIERAHRRMNALIEDLLALARQDERVDETEPLDPGEIVRNCWLNVSTGDAVLNVRLNRRFEGDRGQLSQLFENLFRNSVEHGSTSNRAKPDDPVEHASTGSQTQSDDAVEHGSTSVTVTVGELPDSDGFHVADDGPGIPESEREDVFTAGYSTTPDGTGFGLRIVEQVADAHGWTVRVTESEAGGARFEFSGVAFVPETAEN